MGRKAGDLVNSNKEAGLGRFDRRTPNDFLVDLISMSQFLDQHSLLCPGAERMGLPYRRKVHVCMKITSSILLSRGPRDQ